ncbi:MAG: PEGA domain-containing protein [Candidatus Bathyarchaeota archaeon]|nr:PEGA domain-containing protein [Candidatus Bathyarchaeota archaeon]
MKIEKQFLKGAKVKMPKAAKAVLYIIFWIFVVVAFSIAAIILIFIASGYKYDIFSGQLQKTGMIYLKSEPRAVSVYLNDELKAKKTPVRIPYLLPKTYHVKLTSNRYIDWEADVRVKAGEVSSFDRIVLFLKERKSQNLVKSATSFALSPNKNLVVYVNKSKDKLYLLDLSNDQTSQIYKSKGIIKITDWSANSQKILINDSQNGAMVINRGDVTKNIIINKITGKVFTELSWNPINSNYLYGLAARRLYKIDLLKNQGKGLKSNVATFDVSHYNIFYVYSDKEKYKIRKTNFEGGSSENIVSLNYPIKKLIISHNGRIAILDNKNNLSLYRRTDGEYNLEKLYDRVSEALWGKPSGIIENIVGTEKLGYYTLNEIGGFFRKRDPRFKEEENYLITRINDQIKKILWYSDFEHILYLSNNDVRVVELDGGNDTTLAENIRDFDILADGKELIILESSGLKKVEIRK